MLPSAYEKPPRLASYGAAFPNQFAGCTVKSSHTNKTAIKEQFETLVCTPETTVSCVEGLSGSHFLNRKFYH